MTDQADLQALSDAARAYLRLSKPFEGLGAADAEKRLRETLRAATPVVPAEGLREALDGLLTAAFKDDDFLTQNGIPMTATPGVRRAVRKARAALAASPSPDTACRIEPAFSLHEYAVSYCETHDQPADQCRPSPDTDAGLDGLPPGPYEVRWPNERGGTFVIWGRQGTPPDFKDGWAIPIVACGVQSAMEAIARLLNAHEHSE